MARKPTPASVAKLPHEQYIEAKIIALETFLQSDGAKRNGAALVAATRLATTLRAELEEIRNPKKGDPANPVAELSDGDLLDGMTEAVMGLDDAALDRLEAAIASRRTGKPALRVIVKEQA